MLCDVPDISGEESVARNFTNYNSINNSTLRPMGNTQTAVQRACEKNHVEVV